MSFIDLATERYSVRSFSDKPIEQEKLDLICKAGQVAPTSCNDQSQKVYLIKSPEAMEKVKKCNRFTFGAPMVLLFCYDENKVWHSPWEDGYTTGEMDCSIVCTHMMLQAWELGIGSLWVRGFNAKEVSEVFELPGNIKPVCLMPIGYPSEDAKPSAWHFKNKDISELYEEI